MNVQPYFPEQIVLPGNVANDAYPVRLRFIRTVSVALMLTHALVLCVVQFARPPTGLVMSFWLWMGCTLGLSIGRQFSRHGKLDRFMSAFLLPGTILSLGMLLRNLSDLGFSIWPLGLASASAFLYAMLCGRDFSFTGQFVLSSLATIVGSVMLGILRNDAAESTWVGMVGAVVWLLYHSYDLAALLTRRGRSETFAATVDLYRDVLNFLTYSVRVWMHWRGFRI